MRGRWGRRKRRLAVGACGALAVAVVAPLVAPSAGAVISNAGNVEVTMHLSMFTPTFTVAGMSTTGPAAAIVNTNGVVHIPQSSLSFDPVKVQVNLPVDPTDPASPNVASVVSVQAVATSDFSGAISPKTGAAFFVGNIEELWSQAGKIDSCTVGPFRVTVRTNVSGAIKYSPQTGNVTMVDPGISVGAIPAGASGCSGFAGALNDALSLPVTTTTTSSAPPTVPAPGSDPPVPSMLLSMTLTPAPRAAPSEPAHHSPPPVTTPHIDPTTTTAAPASYGSGSPPPDNSGTPAVVHHARRPAVKHHQSVVKSHSKKKRHPKAVKPTKVVKHRTRVVIHPVKRTSGGGSATGSHHAKTKAKANGKKAASQDLTFVPAAFVTRSPSVLSTGLNVLGLLGLLVFSSLALWLVTSEVSEVSANAKRRRTHRIAGITK